MNDSDLPDSRPQGKPHIVLPFPPIVTWTRLIKHYDPPRRDRYGTRHRSKTWVAIKFKGVKLIVMPSGHWADGPNRAHRIVSEELASYYWWNKEMIATVEKPTQYEWAWLLWGEAGFGP